MTGTVRDTIGALSTPASSRGRHTVRTTGPESLEILLELLPSGTERPKMSHGWFEGDLVLSHTETARVPASLYVMKSPRTYTCEDMVEYHLPGSLPVAELLLEELRSRGARLAEPGEFTERAFLNGRLDLTQAEGVLSLIEARDREERAQALEQVSGTLSERIHDLRDRLRHLCAYVESALDFSDQDIEIIDRDGILSYLNPIRSRIEHILETGRREQTVSVRPCIALFGRPNVGKSSLFNLLIEEDRSIVTEIAGTTRDVIEGTLEVGSQHIRVLDTAGIDEEIAEDSTEAALENKMRERARRAVREAHLVLHLEEAARIWSEGRFPEIEFEKIPDHRIPVGTKRDLLRDSFEEQWASEVRVESDFEPVLTSAKTGAGVEELRETIKNGLQRYSTGSGGAARLNMRHVRHLEEAKENLDRAREVVVSDRPYELAASDLRAGLDGLGKIVGETGVEDILDDIFHEFCIGK